MANSKRYIEYAVLCYVESMLLVGFWGVWGFVVVEGLADWGWMGNGRKKVASDRCE